MKRIVFFIGSADISGGTYVIFQHALYLKQHGYDVSIVTQQPFTKSTLSWHPATSQLTIIYIDELPEEIQWDLAFATWWKTALELHRIKAKQYAYFVQSIESKFYSEQEVPLRKLVDDTYLLPLPIITEATWIQNYLSKIFKRDVQLVKNGIRKDLYCLDGVYTPPPNNKRLRILIEGPLGVSFKNVEKTIELVRKANVGEIWLLTSSEINNYPGVDRVISRVPITEVAQIYRSCDVLVKLSYVEGMFGPPLEIFHCGGTAIVYDVTGYDEYIINNVNALVIKRDDEDGVIAAIKKLKMDPALLARLKRGASETAKKWPNWEQASDNFLKALSPILKAPPVSVSIISEMNTSSWSNYVKDEQKRLQMTPASNMESSIRRTLSFLPLPLINILKKLKRGIIRYVGKN